MLRSGGRIDGLSQVMHGRIRFEARKQHIEAGWPAAPPGSEN
jgi:hypothetical protein